MLTDARVRNDDDCPRWAVPMLTAAGYCPDWPAPTARPNPKPPEPSLINLGSPGVLTITRKMSQLPSQTNGGLHWTKARSIMTRAVAHAAHHVIRILPRDWLKGDFRNVQIQTVRGINIAKYLPGNLPGAAAPDP